MQAAVAVGPPIACLLYTSFAIINADDYYGKEAFRLLHDFLVQPHESNGKFRMGMAGFILKNTLSENGTVTRGICVTDKDGMLTDVLETPGIGYNAEGKLVCDRADSQAILTEDVPVSMNMWAADPDFLDYLCLLYTSWSVIICTRQDRDESRTLCRSGRMIRQSATPMTR